MPALAPIVDKLEDLPEPVRQFYVAKDGKYHVELAAAPQGFVPAADLATANGKVVEFRDNNVKLLQEIEPLRKLKTDLGDIDVAVAKTAVTELKTLKEKGVSKPDDIQTLVQAAVTAAVKPLQEEIATTRTTAQKDRERADDGTFRTTVAEKFVKAGGLPKALDYIVAKAKEMFKVDNGVVVALPNKFSTANPGNPIEVDEWLMTATKEHDFAFKPSTGGGSVGGPGGGNIGSHPPGQIVIRNPTPQQLGDKVVAQQIREGKARFEYDGQQTA
jgi:hypothetical protein